MIVYHGSIHNFHTLRLCSQYTQQYTRENEGVGIYFSTNRSVAEYVRMLTDSSRHTGRSLSEITF